jgi:hypothetical protein
MARSIGDNVSWTILDAACTVLLACGGAALRASTSVGVDLVGLVAVVVALGLWTASAGQRFELEGGSDGQQG